MLARRAVMRLPEPAVSSRRRRPAVTRQECQRLCDQTDFQDYELTLDIAARGHPASHAAETCQLQLPEKLVRGGLTT